MPSFLPEAINFMIKNGITQNEVMSVWNSGKLVESKKSTSDKISIRGERIELIINSEKHRINNIRFIGA